MANVPATAPSGSTWKLVFDDEFNGTKVDTTKWTDVSSAEADGGHGNLGNGQLEWNQMANTSVSDGLLNITAKRESYTSSSGTHYDWTSGLLTTSPSFAFQYGYIEERVKMPADKGFWPAFWTWQAPGVNSWQETDAFEYYTDNHTKVYLTSHVGSGGGSVITPNFDPSADFHTYGVDIEPTGTTWYVDGVKVASAAGSPSAMTNIITNLAVFRDVPAASSTTSATMQVDYVRAFSSAANAVAVTPQAGYDGPGATTGNTGSGNTSSGNTGSGNTGSGGTGSGGTGSGSTGSGSTGGGGSSGGSNTQPTSPGSSTDVSHTTIAVNASGHAAGGVNAHFNLLVDGHKVGEGTVGGTAKTFTFATDVSADHAHKVEVQYDNDGYVNGQDRNLTVNSVSINGHSVLPTDASVTYDRGALDGKDVIKGQSNLWWNGTLVVNADATQFPAGGTPVTTTTAQSTIKVSASGQAAGGENAHFNLLVDGHKVGEGTAASYAKTFTFKTDLTTDQAHKVQVQYDNDAHVNGQDRNLIVSKVTINGHAVLPTDSGVTYDKGALDGKDVVKGQSGMWWDGTLVVNADASYFPAAKAAALSASLSTDAATTLWTHVATQQAGTATTTATAQDVSVHAVDTSHDATAPDAYGHLDHHHHQMDTAHLSLAA